MKVVTRDDRKHAGVTTSGSGQADVIEVMYASVIFKLFWRPKQQMVTWKAVLVLSRKRCPNNFNTQPIMRLVRLKKTTLTFITSYEICPFFKGLDCAFQIEIDMTAN